MTEAEKPVELSEEDQELQEKFELLVSRLQDSKQTEQALALLEEEVRGATTSMTSIPKPLKILRPFYPAMKEFYQNLAQSALKQRLANFLSVCAITMSKQEDREVLGFLLQGNTPDLVNWGYEYIRNLCGEMRDEFFNRFEKNQDNQEILDLTTIVVPYLMQHSSEVDAVDLLCELDCLDRIVPYVDMDNYQRVCLYISTSAQYAADPDEMLKTLHVCFQCYLGVGKFPEALRIALKINRPEYIQQVFDQCKDSLQLKQMCYFLGRQKYNFEIDNDELTTILSNEHLCTSFAKLATDLDVLEPKSPEDIYKSHLEEHGRGINTGAPIDSAQMNLAQTFVNAFVNCGYGTDTLLTDESKNWLFKHKDTGLMSAAASIGSLLLWNMDEGTARIDKYQYSQNDYIKAGALMALGIVNAGIKSEYDPAFALLTEYIDTSNDILRNGIIAGLTLAYAGSAREDVLEVLTPLVIDSSISFQSSALAALALGLVFVGTCNEDVAQAIVQTLMERTEEELKNPWAKFFALGIGLVFLGQQDRVSTILGVIQDFVGDPLKGYAKICIESCAYAGSGNVLKVQEMLHVCADHGDDKDIGAIMASVLGIATIAMGEDIGASMALRCYDHLLQYGDINIKRVTPLGIAMLFVSNPKVNVIDLLSKLSHDNDPDTAQSAIFALGMVGAGTNNSRLAGTLRQLAGYYSRDSNQLFMVRIAQGLLHLGKGLMTLRPYHSENFLLSPVALSGILTVIHSMLQKDEIIHTSGSYMLFYLTAAIYPRMLVTLDENLNSLPVQVRVGEAVDVVGQAGRPRTITGFQTHTTPVLLSYGEKAELATEQYIPVTEVLENFVILKPNPNYVPEEN